MAVKIPIKRHDDGLGNTDGLAEFEPNDSVGITDGGTGANSSAGARNNLLVARSTLSTINGQTVITTPDPLRANKLLSVSMIPFMWAEAAIGNNEWIQIAHAVDTLSGYIMPLDCTIVMITAHCEDTNGNTKPIRIYQNGTNLGDIITVPAGTDSSAVVTNLDIDFNQGDKIRLRANGGGGTVQDTVITLFVKWRA